MIILFHKFNEVVKATNSKDNSVIPISEKDPKNVLFKLGQLFPEEIICWCDDDLKEFIDFNGFGEVFTHPLVMASYETENANYIPERIGYVESSPFVKVNRQVTYPTWLMSTKIGAIRGNILNQFKIENYKFDSFGYTLNSVAKLGMSQGLFCYSSPKLLKTNIENGTSSKSSSHSELFKFVREHYKMSWTFLLFLNFFMYDRKLKILSLIKSLQKSRRTFSFTSVKENYQDSPYRIVNTTIDVVIPTLGRKDYLYNVLKDLSSQTLLPKTVIIVEQNSDINSKSELNFLSTKSWPFKISHHFTHELGACKSRNKALNEVCSDFVFLADDDIRFESDLLERAMFEMVAYKLNAATLSCLRKGESERIKRTKQWPTFGAGCSIVKSQFLKGIRFDESFEHGFGEDADFGMQLRNHGIDISYLPNCQVVHLKAPLGGFRKGFPKPWEKEMIQPKPTPTIMLFNLKHLNKFQLMGYKTTLFIKFFKIKANLNVFGYVKEMNNRWNQSIIWANYLQQANDG